LKKKDYDSIVNHIATFKKNFNSVQSFITDTILANFDNCEFYTCEEGELGECMIIPAQYVGESTAPLFYLFQDGIKEKKE